MGFEVSYREHKRYADYDPIIVWSKATATIFRGYSTPIASLGGWYMFFVVNRAWLHGKYVRWRWRGNYTHTFATNAQIWDGEYDRSSMVDFPNGAAPITKGNGVLQILDTNTGSFVAETKDIQADTSGGSEEKCTIIFWSSDAWSSQQGYYELDWIEMNTGAGGVGTISDEQFTDAIITEQTGTNNDYGYIGYGQADPNFGSADLKAGFDVQATEDLLGEFIARHADSEELKAGFDAQATEELSGEFTVRHAGSEELLGEFEVGQGAEDLLGEFISRKAYEEVLDAEFIVRAAASQSLPSELCVHTPRIGQDLNAWTEYDPEEELDHDCNDSWWNDVPRLREDTSLTKDVGAVGLGSDFFHELVLNVYGVGPTLNGAEERICAWAGSISLADQNFYDLPANEVVALIVMATDAVDQYQLMLIEKGGNSATMATVWPNYQDRYIVIYKQGASIVAASYQDAAHTILEDSATIALSGDLNLRYISVPMSYGQLGAETSSGLADPVFGSMENLPCEFTVRHADAVQLHGEFIVQQIGSAELRAGFDGQVVEELLGEFVVRHADSEDLPGEFIARQAASVELHAGFDAQAVRNLPAEFEARRSSQQVLLAGFVVKQGSEDLLGEFISQQSGSRALLCVINIVHSLDLGAEFEIRRSSLRDLACEFIVRYIDSQELPAQFEVIQPSSEDLSASFIALATSDGIIIISLDPGVWVNEIVNVGTGFLSAPIISQDYAVKVIGSDAFKAEIIYQPDSYDYIKFGWRSKVSPVPSAYTYFDTGGGVWYSLDDPEGWGGWYWYRE